MKCDICDENIEQNRATCDWRQGRCPHRHPMFNEIVLDTYKMRVYTLVQWIKNWFK